MSTVTSIEWTDRSWNPIRGCSRVSTGCEHCYAEKIAARFSGPGMAYEGLARRRSSGKAQWTGKIRVVVDALTEPLHWRKPCRVFVNSMSDLFHEGVPDAFIAAIFAVMALSRQHTFQVLTKRPERMRDLLNDSAFPATVLEAATLLPGGSLPLLTEGNAYLRWPLPNVWLGVSVENQECADQRIPVLLETPAAVRFLSCEPLLSSVDLTRVGHWTVAERTVDVLRRGTWDFNGQFTNHSDMDAGIDWVIVGGESGAGSRPCALEWIRSIVTQCRNAETAVFVKQLGAKPVGEWGPNPPACTVSYRGAPDRVELRRYKNGIWRLTHRKGGWIDEWPADLRVRQFPRSATVLA